MKLFKKSFKIWQFWENFFLNIGTTKKKKNDKSKDEIKKIKKWFVLKKKKKKKRVEKSMHIEKK